VKALFVFLAMLSETDPAALDRVFFNRHEPCPPDEVNQVAAEVMLRKTTFVAFWNGHGCGDVAAPWRRVADNTYSATFTECFEEYVDVPDKTITIRFLDDVQADFSVPYNTEEFEVVWLCEPPY